MTGAAFLAHLQRLDIRLTLDGERLRCNAPKGAITPDLKAELARRKAELIELLRSDRPVAAEGGIPRADRDQPLPLSVAQERLWFLEELDPVPGVYNIPVAVRLRGPLRAEILEQSLNEIVCRHEVLRTRFVKDGGKVRAAIAESIAISLAREDLTAQPALWRWTEAQRLQKIEAQRPFDLTQDALIRAGLLRLAVDDHLLLLTMHHLVCDGWSLGVLLKELAVFYTALAAGRKPSAPEIGVQYADYAMWQRQQFEGELLQRQLAYWRDRLAGELPVLSLPTDRARPAAQTFAGATHRTALSKELVASLETLAHGRNATLFMVLVSAYAALLSRYAGQSEVVIGTPIAGRTRSELEPLVGCFVNTLALRVSLAGEPGFQELLDRVREAAVGAFSHQDVPFERLVEELQPKRDLSRTPLFQAMFILQNSPMPELALADLQLEVLPEASERAKFELTLDVERRGDELEVRWNYNTDLFEAQTIRRMARQFKLLLRGALADPRQRVSRIPILSSAEHDRIVGSFNSTSRPYELDRSLHGLIEAQAARTPDATAVVFEGSSLTYAELDRRANQLASHLQSLGVGPEVLVGICLERSVEMVVGLLGILKAGGAYVPIDPTYPRDRLAYMLADSGVPVLLTQARLVDQLPEHRARTVCLDRDWATISSVHGDSFCPGGAEARSQGRKPLESVPAESHSPEGATEPGKSRGRSSAPLGRLARDDKPSRGLRPWLQTSAPDGADTEASHLAYMIYTSGSTGRPKGAMNEHRAIVNRLLWMQEMYGLTAHDRILQKTPFSFDVSVWEFFWPLMTGATLVVARPEGHKDAAYLAKLIQQERITTIHFVPSMLEVFLNEPQAKHCESLKRVICSGEALSWDLKEKYQATLKAGLHNLYGPTEAAVDVTFWPCDEAIDRKVVPIGRPVANTRIYILDRYLQPVPIGVSGELYIAGIQVGRGYRQRPELTGEKFVPDPFSETPGARMYRTGDLARHLPNGAIEYLGRLDDQVKIRGFRIELGEIEARIREQGEFSEATVVARDGAGGDKQLVAYVVPRDGHAANIADLRGFLKDRLPEYMVPSFFVELKALPLSPNGKLDRKALPEPKAGGMASGRTEYVAPRTPAEEMLAGAWAGILGLDRVGVIDDFFDLGGHSLLATQVISRIRDLFGVELPLRAVFESPTVAELAARVAAGRDEVSPAPTAITPVNRRESLPLSFAQERLWFLEELDSIPGVYNIPMAVRVRGPLRIDALERDLGEIVRRHEVLRTRFVKRDGKARAEIDAEVGWALPILDLSSMATSEQHREVDRLQREEAQGGFDLARGPLIRGKVLRLDADHHVLLLTAHHLVCDGWSLGVLLRELAELYGTCRADRDAILPDLGVQYVDYACWQRRRLDGEFLDSQLAYWRQVLGGEPTALNLPTDRPRPAAPSFAGATHRAVLSNELTASLESLARGEGATLFMVLMGAFATLLGRYSGQDEIVLGTPVAGRTRSEVEPLIGLFVNMLAMRTDLGGAPSFREVIGRVRETALGAYAHQDLPFEKLVEELHPKRDMSRSPVFQAVFILQNAPMPALQMGDLILEVLPEAGSQAKFDLALEVERRDAGLVLNWNYSTDLFEASTIERMARHWEALLHCCVADPDRNVRAHDLLSEEEQRQLLGEFADTRQEWPDDRGVVQLFEEQVDLHPDATAVVHGGGSLSFRQLNDRANQLARHLRSLGVGAEVLVGIFLDRSLEMMVGLLGILKAGGAYVPLDPAYPRERIAFMIQDARARVLITCERLLGDLPPHDARVVCMDRDWPAIAGRVAENPESGAGPNCLAYAIYTSGSTGKPKGVLIQHNSLANLIKWQAAYCSVSSSDRVSQVASMSFDASVIELWPHLASGACIHLIDDETRRSPNALQEYLVDQGITIAQVPTSLAEMLIQMPWPANTALRILFTGGDRLGRYPAPGLPFQLINHYGPTENTVSTTTYRPRSQAGDVRTGPPIGRPNANTRVYILDAHLRPVPIGVAGEIHISGTGLARGYLNCPDLTAERFIPDPFSSESGARMYRSGDLGRFLPDGNIEFMGRLDHQVKIRGYRIELGEIESTLMDHPLVSEAVVSARESDHGAKQLVAYLVGKGGGSLDTGIVRAYLRERLPEYMVPTAFVALPSLPLSPNGKVDRRRLPPPETARPVGEEGYAAPRTSIEHELAGIWQELLRLDRVGIHDNFFELGGDSILSIQVVSRAQRAGLRFTAKNVFQHQTIAELAELAGQAAVAASEPDVATGEVHLTPIQRWLFDGDLPDPHHWNQSVLLQTREAIDLKALSQAVQALILQHDTLRLRFFQDASGWRQVAMADQSAVPVTEVDLSSLPVVEHWQSIERESAAVQAGLDLANGPLLRVAWFDLGPDRPGRLLIVAHHLAVDGISWRVLLEDLQAAYVQAKTSRPIELPPKTTSFRRWASLLAERATSSEVREELDFWLSNGPGGALPFDDRDGANDEASAERVSVKLDEAETAALLREVHHAYRTQINDVLLAALMQTMARWTGVRKLQLALEGHGRESLFEGVDVSRTVGWFTSVYPLTLEMPSGDGPGELLKSIKEQLRRVPAGGVGYGLLRYLSGDAAIVDGLRDLDRSQLSFNYLGQFDQVLAPSDGGERLFVPAGERTGPEHGPRAPRRFVLEVNALVAGGSLRIDWVFSRNLHRRATIEALATAYLDNLRAIIDHCRLPDAGGFTPSDFPLAGLSQEQLDKLFGAPGQGH